MVKVALIIGRFEPGRCGVGDYTLKLCAALRRAGVEAEVVWVDEKDWSVGRTMWLRRLILKDGADVVHLQYPLPGAGHKLGPQVLAALLPCVVTIHEASQTHFLRKASLVPFMAMARYVVFTSNEERAFCMRWWPWVSSRSCVIPIGSNIDAGLCPAGRDLKKIVYFGLIRPKKGLEDVLELARVIKEKGLDWKVHVVGNRRESDSAFAAEFERTSKGLPLTWEEGLCAEEVAERLGEAGIAYLPYPDGASERRGSLKAALASGMVVITSRGPDTPAELEPVVKFCSSPAEALAIIEELVRNPETADVLGRRARAFALRYSWERIAQLHAEIYERVVWQHEHFSGTSGGLGNRRQMSFRGGSVKELRSS